MKILVACEYSGIVRDAFLAKGHDAISCDLDPQIGEGPFYHGDVLDILYDGWDMMIAHPPCTYLCSSGLHWNKKDPERALKTEAALEFVKILLNAPIEKIALENPVGCISTRIRKPDQYIQMYDFGENASKKTGLWLKNLPKLKKTKYVEPRWVCCNSVIPIEEGCLDCMGKNKPLPRWGNQTNSGQNKLPPSASRGKDRSKTYSGVAEAMADQWG